MISLYPEFRIERIILRVRDFRFVFSIVRIVSKEFTMSWDGFVAIL